MQNFFTPRPEVVEVVLPGDGEGGHILAGVNLEVLDILLQVRNIHTEIFECQGQVENIGGRPPVQLSPGVTLPPDGLDVPEQE